LALPLQSSGKAVLGRDERYKDAGREGEQVTGGWEIPEVENGHAGEVAEGVGQSRNEVFTEIQFLQIQALTKAVGELFDLPHLKLLKLPTSLTLFAFHFSPILVSIPDTYPTKIRQTADPHSHKKLTFFLEKNAFFWEKGRLSPGLGFKVQQSSKFQMPRVLIMLSTLPVIGACYPI